MESHSNSYSWFDVIHKPAKFNLISTECEVDIAVDCERLLACWPLMFVCLIALVSQAWPERGIAYIIYIYIQTNHLQTQNPKLILDKSYHILCQCVNNILLSHCVTYRFHHHNTTVTPLTTSGGEIFRSECLLKLLLRQRGVGDQEAAKQRWSAAVRMEYQNRTKDASTGVLLIRETRDVAQQPKADPKPLLPHMGSFLEPEPDHESQSSPGGVVFSPAEDPQAKRHCGLLRSSSMISVTTVATEVASASASPSVFSSSHVDPVQLANIPTPQGMWSHCRKDLQSCHKNFLIHLVEKGDAKISELKGTIRTLNKQLARLNASKTSLELQLQQSNTDEDNQIDTALDVSPIGVVKLSSRGTIALGLRKSLALTSAAGFPLASLVDVSRYTVVKAEVCMITKNICSNMIYRT